MQSGQSGQSGKSDGRDESPHSLVDSVRGGAWYNAAAVLWLLMLALVSALDNPGVTRPYPGATITLGGMSAVIAAVFALRRRPNSRSLAAFVLPAALVLWLCLSTALNSLDTFRSQQAIASWVSGVAVFYIAASTCVSGRLWRALLTGLSLIACGLSAYGFLALSDKGAFSATFSNRDSFSVIPMIGIFLAMAQTQARHKAWRTIGWVLVGLLGLTVIRSESRAALAGLALGVLIIPGAAKFDKKARKMRAVLQNVALALVITLAVAVVTGLAGPVTSRIADMFSGKDAQGIAMRVDVLQHGLRTATARPILGSGPGTFALAYQEYRPQSIVPEYIYVNVAHNDFVELAVEVGWVGFTCWLVLWILVMSRGVRLIKSAAASWEASCMLGGLTSLLVFCALNFIVAVPCLLIWQMLTLGALVGLPASSPSRRQPPNRSQKALAILLGLAGCWTIMFGLQSALSSFAAEDAKGKFKQLRFEEAVAQMDRAIRWQPGNPTLYAFRGLSQARLSQFQGKPEQLARAAEDLKRAGAMSPRDPNIARMRLQFLESNRLYAQAEKVISDAHKFSPYRQEHLEQLTRLGLLQNRLEVAARTLYQGSLYEQKQKDLLVSILVNLEVQKPNAGVALVEEWSDQEGQTRVSLGLARKVAEAALAQKQVQAAQRMLLFVTTREPDDPGTKYILSKVYQAQDKPQQRLAMLEQIVKQSHIKKADPNVDLAVVDWASLQPDRTDQAVLGALEERLKLSSQSVPLRLMMSQLYLEAGRTEMASEVVANGLDIHPENPDLLARMGTCLQKQGLADLAGGYYDQALAKDPKNAEARAKGLPKTQR